MNEKGISMGESTCASKITAKQCKYNGQRDKERNCALLSVNELTRIGLERTDNAVEAIKIMGSLAEEYGFYGPGGNDEGTGESLLIADMNDTWIFHIVSDDEKGTSAVWVAQKVPSDHAAVVANLFVIREIDFNDSNNFMYSKNIKDVAIKRGYWKDGEKFDFT